MVADAMQDPSPVLVFARAPIPGRVKTRLIPALGAERAARLHRRMLWRTLEIAVDAGCGPVELWCSPGIEHPFFSEVARAFGVTLHAQSRADLGARMHRALDAACARAACAVLVGSDCPALERADLCEAARALGSGADAVLGPAHDGGYYLIGVRRSDPRVFSGIEWGSSDVADATRARFRALDWRWRELATRRDVDRPEDLAGLDALLDAPPAAKAPIF